MAAPQPAIFVEGTRSHRFQEYSVTQSSAAEVGHFVGTVAAAAAGENPVDTVQVVVAFGASLARSLGVETPPGFRHFETIGERERVAEATPADVLVWMHSDTADHTFDVALAARRAGTSIGSLERETAAFVYRDSRDLTGFVDGTENPSASEARDVAVVGAGQPGAGGSVVLAQRWVHDLDRFHALETREQELVIGRTKPDSVELDESRMPPDSHVSRVVMEDQNGDEIEIYRRSVPYGSSTEAGLFFLSFTDHLPKVDNMLSRMFGVGDNTFDRLTDFSRAISSAYYFAPDQNVLDALCAPSSETKDPE